MDGRDLEPGRGLHPGFVPSRQLYWLVIGGESGPGARPFNVDWARQAIAQCDAAGVAVYVKQLGARPYTEREAWHEGPMTQFWSLRDRKGADMAEWPEDLRRREYPR